MWSSYFMLTALTLSLCPGFISTKPNRDIGVSELFWGSMNDLTELWNAFIRSDFVTMAIKVIDVNFDVSQGNGNPMTDTCLKMIQACLKRMQPIYYKMFPSKKQNKKNVQSIKHNTPGMAKQSVSPIVDDEVLQQTIGTAVNYINDFRKSDMYKGIMNGLLGNKE